MAGRGQERRSIHHPQRIPTDHRGNGGEGLNANTDDDETNYFYSLPANRLELWAYLESERFLHPVMREFYDERNVVIEERRMRVDSNPIGRLLEQFVTAAFQASQYHRPTIGWMSDLNTFSATDAAEILPRVLHPVEYGGGAGGRRDSGKGAAASSQKYFGRLPARPKPDERVTAEPPQNSERRIVLHEAVAAALPRRLSSPRVPQSRTTRSMTPSPT